ncbi:MAG: hypothetical protein JNM77_03280 [Pseudonocardia sp.]|nr:hypothetical protein [Pseudonocardia sp.]
MPRVPARHVGRPRLLALLDAAEPGGLLLVSAPAGYGKSQLLAEWAARRPDRIAWLSLDDDDRVARRFWAAVLAALRGCAAVGPALDRLDPAQDGFLVRLLEALDRVPGPVDLVLDDVHALPPGSAAVRALAALVRERPRALRLVLAGRADPPLPIARLRLSGELREIRARDLAFSPDEAAALLTGADLVLAPGQVRTLVDQTGGWAAGLRLAALSLRDAGDVDRFLADLAGNSKALSDYLVGEVLSALPPGTTEVLQAVSVCDELSAGLAVALTGRPDAGEVLASLERETALVQSFGEGRTAYRAHPLLRAHLMLDLRRRHPERVARLHAAAADWFAVRGRPARALAHARQADDDARLAELLVAQGVALVASGEHAAVRDALRALDRAAVRPGDPRIALLAALVGTEDGAPAAVRRHLARAGTVRAADPDLATMGRLDRAVALVLAGRSGEARRYVEDALADARRHDRGYLAARATSVLALVAAADGEYRRMAELAAAADAELASGGWRATAGAGLPRLLGAYGALLDLHPERCLDLLAATPADPADTVFVPLRSALRAAALTDLHRDAEPQLRLARSALACRVPPRLAAPAVLLAHGVAVDLGRPDLAADLTRRAGELLGSTGDLVLMAARQEVSGSGAVRDVLAGAVAPVVPWAVGEAHARACAAALADGRSPLARRELEAALAAAGATGALRPLLAGGAAVTGLLARQVGSFGAGDAVAARVLAVGDRPDGPHRGPSAFTERERDVLGLLSSPRSLQEIATVLGVAPSTVKTHVRAIYTKLGVRSRRAAVAAGRRGGAVAVGRR